MAFTSTIKQVVDTTYLVTLITARGPAWFYLSVEKAKTPLFLKAMKQPSIDLAVFGSILIRGFGKAPSEDVRQKFAA